MLFHAVDAVVDAGEMHRSLRCADEICAERAAFHDPVARKPHTATGIEPDQRGGS